MGNSGGGMRSRLTAVGRRVCIVSQCVSALFQRPPQSSISEVKKEQSSNSTLSIILRGVIRRNFNLKIKKTAINYLQLLHTLLYKPNYACKRSVNFYSFPVSQHLIFNVHGSVHCNNILIYIQQDASLHSFFIWKLLYIFRMVPSPIIRSANNCIYSIWYLSHRYYYLPLSWKIWNWFECAVGVISMYSKTPFQVK